MNIVMQVIPGVVVFTGMRLVLLQSVACLARFFLKRRMKYIARGAVSPVRLMRGTLSHEPLHRIDGDTIAPAPPEGPHIQIHIQLRG